MALWRAGSRRLHRRGKSGASLGVRRISQVWDRGGSATGRRRVGRQPPEARALSEPSPASTEPAPRRTPLHDAAPRARRPDGRFRRLGPAGAVPGRHHGRAPALPRRRRAVRRLAHGPGAVRRRGRRRRASSAWCPATSRASAPGRAALHRAHQRAGRHPRRPDRQPDRRRPLFVVVNAGCRDADLAHLRARARARAPGRGADRPRAAGAAGAAGRRGPGPPRAGGGRAALHADRRDGRRRPAPAGSRARATPARTASRSRSRPSDAAALARLLLDQAGGRARRPRRARFAAPRGRPCLYGHEIDARRPRRSRPGSPGRSASAGARRAASRAPRRSCASCATARPASSSASARTAARPRARAPRSRTPDGRPIGHRHQRRLRPDRRRAGRHGLCRGRARRARHAAHPHRPRQAACRPRSPSLPFVPHRYQR